MFTFSILFVEIKIFSLFFFTTKCTRARGTIECFGWIKSYL